MAVVVSSQRTALACLVLVCVAVLPHAAARSFLESVRTEEASVPHGESLVRSIPTIATSIIPTVDSTELLQEESAEQELIEGDIIPSESLRNLLREASDDASGEDDSVGGIEEVESEKVPGLEEILFGQRPTADGVAQGERTRRGLTKSKSLLWPGGIVPFKFEENWAEDPNHWFKSRRAVEKAMRHIHEKSCIRFRPQQEYAAEVGARHPDATNYIMFRPTSPKHPYCSTYVGRQFGIIPVFIGPDCYDSFGSVVHELLHVLGFYHEQSRPDRDRYVTIKPENIIDYEMNKANFRKYSHGEVDSLSVPYDYDSVMHYSSTQFSKDEQNFKTIVAKDDPERKLGQREKMSVGDVLQLNKLYGCPVPVQHPCDAMDYPVQYHQTVSFRYRKRKWLYCDATACRRKSCMNFSDSLCDSEPNGCRQGKFTIVPAKDIGTTAVISDGDPVRIENALDLFPGHILHCETGATKSADCKYIPCEVSRNCSAASSTFTIRKRPGAGQLSKDGSVIYQNSNVSLCLQNSAGSDYEQCVSCVRNPLNPVEPCRLVKCNKRTDDCLGNGVFFSIRQWPAS
ncbi:uncharacterized protein LOC135823299 [Sycon ciliatum]|uniref:uncharacterized protein LOC135823299 n=1 Tax=Sycon ciliatum TaxID=27933 RepID=UPI0031F6C354